MRSNPTLQREDWLGQGLKQLGQDGIESVTIDSLCGHFKVTKGSFYHHFKNQKSFHEAILAFWEENYTSQFIEESLKAEMPLNQLERLTGLVVAHFGTQEARIRSWAQTSPIARNVLKRVDRRRLEFLFDLQLRIHPNRSLAKTISHLQYTALVGSAQILPPLSAGDLKAMYLLINEVIQKETKTSRKSKKIRSSS